MGRGAGELGTNIPCPGVWRSRGSRVDRSHERNRRLRAYWTPGRAIPGKSFLFSTRPEALAAESPRPEEITIRVDSNETGWVIVSQLADPQWKARWLDEEGRDYGEAEILPTFHKKDEPGGWQRVEIPGSGRLVLRLTYDARDVSVGLAISVLAWMCWMMVALYLGFRSASVCGMGPVFARTSDRAGQPCGTRQCPGRTLRKSQD